MGKTRDLFKKIGDTKGIFHAKMGSKKDRNGMELTEAEDIKNRWQEEELYKKDLHDPDNHDCVITHIHLEPDTLECEIKWVLGSITTKIVEVMNRFKGLDLVDGVCEDYRQVCNILQEVVTKTIPKKKKCEKAKWLSEEALQKKRSKKQRRKGRIYPFECRVPNNSQER